MKLYKGFDENLKCREFQYEIGKEYEEENASLCNSGFHACELPHETFGYYSPGNSRYCVTDLDVTDEHGDDSKRCGKKIKIETEVSVFDIVKISVKAFFERFEFNKKIESADTNNAGYGGAANTGNCGAANAGYKGAANAGDRGAANAGNWGAANAGDWGAANAGNCGAANAGDWGAANAGNCGAANAGDWGAANAGNWGAANAGDWGAANAGNCGAAIVRHRGKARVSKEGVAVAFGYQAKACGDIGAVLVLCQFSGHENENDYNRKIKEVKAVIVDGEKIKANTYYMLKNGKVVEIEGGLSNETI